MMWNTIQMSGDLTTSKRIVEMEALKEWIQSPLVIYLIVVLLAVVIFIVFRRILSNHRNEAEPIDELEGHDFEMYCSDLLRNNGFDDVTVTKGSGDFGLDILCERDGVTYGIQCKRYDKPIGVYAVQQAYAGRDYYDRMVGVVMTNQSFTDAAERAAKKLNILLWDRKEIRALEG